MQGYKPISNTYRYDKVHKSESFGFNLSLFDSLIKRWITREGAYIDELKL